MKNSYELTYSEFSNFYFSESKIMRLPIFDGSNLKISIEGITILKEDVSQLVFLDIEYGLNEDLYLPEECCIFFINIDEFECIITDSNDNVLRNIHGVASIDDSYNDIMYRFIGIPLSSDNDMYIDLYIRTSNKIIFSFDKTSIITVKEYCKNPLKFSRLNTNIL